MAVTGADVRTYRTLQIKGLISAAVPPTPDDLDLAKQHIDGFVSEVVDVDQFPQELVERFPAVHFDIYVIDVEEVFDQSPGPNAGEAVGVDGWSSR